MFAKKILKYLVAPVGICFCFISCKINQSYQSPGVGTDSLFRGVSGADTTTLATMHWHDLFTDTLLQKLIQEGIDNNLDLKTAYSRLRQARISYRQSKMAFYPSVQASASQSVNTSSGPALAGSNTNRDQFDAQVAASWEIDVWGKLRAGKRAGLAALLREDAAVRAVQTSVVADIATYYYQLLALDQQLAYTRASAGNWQTTVDVMTKLKQSAVVTSAAIVQSEASKYAVEATIPDLEKSVRETENALNVVLGHVPTAVIRGALAAEMAPVTLSAGVPAQLLANRPDVQSAEMNLRYYFELTNVARTYFYPSLKLSASGGYLTLGQLWNPGSWFGSIVAGLTQPIFSQSLNKSRLLNAKEQQQQALFNFESIILTSGREVSDALFSYQASVNKTNARNNQLANLDKSVAYTQKLVSNGFANYTEVLTAQQSLLSAQLSQVSDKLQQLTAVVQLYRSLGGGWR